MVPPEDELTEKETEQTSGYAPRKRRLSPFTSLTPLGQITAVGAFANLNFTGLLLVRMNLCSQAQRAHYIHGLFNWYPDCSRMLDLGWRRFAIVRTTHRTHRVKEVEQRLRARPIRKKGSLWTVSRPTQQDLLLGLQEAPINDDVSRETNLKPRAPFRKTPSVPVSMDSRPALTDLRGFSDSPLCK